MDAVYFRLSVEKASFCVTLWNLSQHDFFFFVLEKQT